jgi:Contractile injection system tube protein/LysM domain
VSSVQRAHFQRLDKNLKPIEPGLEVQFNPTEFTLAKGVQIAEINIPGLDSPILQFVRGQTETLTLDLFFDTTDQGTGDTARSVTTKTDKFYQLIKIDNTTHAPPICHFTWGGTNFPGANFDDVWSRQKRENGFDCLIENVRQRFTMFSTLGVPLRATLTVAMREYKTLDKQLQQLGLNSPDHTRTHVVQQGETLNKIADKYYDDSTQWRVIADANTILDPLALQVGMILELPPLD